MSLSDFRAEVAAWLEDNCPVEMRRPVLDEDDLCFGGRRPTFQSVAQRLWMERMAARGWTTPEWPKEYGGGGLNHEAAKVLSEEMHRLGCRLPLSSFGIWMLGPALLKYGTQFQKRELLPPIIRGEIRWCQGYSEPNAGSDLAALATRAEDRGEHFLVNGQKIWTSFGHKADAIFCLVRTGPMVPKHAGISFLLIDMTTAGVVTRPIVLISGQSPFCETFFTDVRVPKSNVVGEINKGWDVAKYLLTHERTLIAGLGNLDGDPSLGKLAAAQLGLEAGVLPHPSLRAQLAQFDTDMIAFRCMLERFGDLMDAGQASGSLSSVIKYYGAELNKRRHELLMSIGGTAALEWESERSQGGTAARDWLRTKANSIEGGSSEIQLNIIAKRILNLPGA